MRLLCLAGLFCLVWLWVSPVQAAGRPNVLLILADDMAWGDVHSHGNEKIDTPNLDRLAGDGARFDRFFVMPVCAPTRAGLLTGRYHLRGGVHGVTRGYEDLREDETTFAQVFKGAGYATGIFGKWHNGAHFPRDPNGKGFDEFLGFCAGHWNNYHDPILQHNETMEPQKGYITDVLTDAAMKFIDATPTKPWLCYVPYNVPHTPWQAPEDLWQKYKARNLATPEEACCYAMVERMDWNIGRLMEKLKTSGQEDNTIVIFLSDNGPNTVRYNGDMRGRKGMVHEGGVRVPFFIKWPKRITAQATVPNIACCVDVLPTLCDLCGVAFKPDAEHPLDGISLVPLLSGKPASWPDRYVFTHQAPGDEVKPSKGAVRSQKYRAVYEPVAGPKSAPKWQLYDLENDPSQRADIAKDYPDILAPMTAAYDKWFADATKRGFEPLPIPVGLAGHPEVLLQAHQAFLQTNEDEGGIGYKKSKAGFANDWIAQWTDPKAFVHWHVDVRRAGKYEVFIDLTCPAAAVGSGLAIEIAGKQAGVTASEAFDPAVLPEQDLIERAEPAEKPWKRLSVGVLDLPQGRTDLLLKLTKLVGGSGPEVKAVLLRAQ